ncbi:MAG: HD domain-containing protein, partial [Candidatus Omnitrophica bacterium]|nr:HD domain-containing protein [Candidatus Omnitrophota bacterium]
TVYRLITTINDLATFSTGVCRLLRNIFKANKVVMVCKVQNSSAFLKIRLEGKIQSIKKGGKSILTTIEKEILQQEKEIIFNNRLIYPFIFSNTLGAIYIKRDSKSKDFSETERKWFLSLCEEISIGLKVFNLYKEQQKIMLNYIKSLSTFLTQYVPTSHLHVKAISRLINAMGKALKLSEAEIKCLNHAALLHDAGKIKLPSKLLRKQKPLTDEEYKLIEKHPQKGVEFFRNLEILRPAIPIILHHHERYDGQGYPSKLKKEKIPLGSRILSVLDTFDAMYFGRPYKGPHTLEKIEQEFKKQKGRQFDPKIVDTFLKIIKRKNIRNFLKNCHKTTI